MRKISIFLVLCSLLCGCSAAKKATVHPVVTAISITVQNGSHQEVLAFTSDRETSWVLNYLRTLSDCGEASVNPAYVKGPMYTFSLQFSDGSFQTLRQKNERYFMDTDGIWREIEPYSGSRIRSMLVLCR